jgi:transposase
MLAHLVRRTTTTQGLVRRAGIVLAAAAEGANNQQVADRLGFDRETVRLWRGRWLEARERLAAAEEADEKKLRRCIEDVLDDAPRTVGAHRLSPRSRSAL